MVNVVVTGASSGIGRALAREFASAGARVLGSGRNEEALKSLKEELGEGFDYVVCDLGSLECVRAVARRAAKSFSPIDVLVNNAGYGLGKGLLEMTPEEVAHMAMVNFVAPLALTRELLPHLRPGSAVVNVVTAGVHILMTRLPLYGATKMGLHYASAALRRELKARGVRLLEVFPGVVQTRFHERAGLSAPMRAVPPEKAAREIIRALQKGKERLYIPWYIGFLRFFGPYLPALF